jgi:integrase
VAGEADRERQERRMGSAVLPAAFDVMRAAVENDMIPATPCRGHRLPRVTDPDPEILTPAEVDAIASHCPKPLNLLVLVLGYAGLRIGEAFALRKRDVQDDGRTLAVARRKAEIGGRPDFDLPKSHQVRAVQVPAFLAKQLGAHARTLANDDDLLFVNTRGRVLTYNAWRRRVFDPAVTAAGLVGVTPHDLRASHASWVADKHGVLAAARRLGHSNASVTTRHYARAIKERDDDVAKGLDKGKKQRDKKRKGTRDPEAREGHDDDQADVA